MGSVASLASWVQLLTILGVVYRLRSNSSVKRSPAIAHEIKDVAKVSAKACTWAVDAMGEMMRLV
jgi:hypothetical protein